MYIVKTIARPPKKGTWDSGQLSGHAAVLYKSGNRYTGGFANGLRSGRGVMYTIKSG